MLRTLLIKDYALIENIEVNFGSGLNIITGETGAGKSILIDAMGLLLGERASTEVVRKGAEKSIVEGIFESAGNKKVKKLCDENEIDFNDDLIVRREISLKGTNRCFINDTPVTLNLIKEIGDLLVDLHGQHEHQSLLREETHIEMLDSFANLESDLEEYKKLFHSLNQLQKEFKEIKEKENLLKEKKELYQFQIKEIDSVNPLEDEDEKLEQELNVLENSEKILLLANEIYGSLYDDENSIQDQLGLIKNKIAELAKIDRSFIDVMNNFESSIALIKDVSTFTRSYKESVDLESERLEEIRERIGSINLLKKKYGGSIKSILEHREKIGSEFDLAENFSSKISDLSKQIDEARRSCGAKAKDLSQKRKTASKKIEKEIKEVLKNLGITDGQFQVKIQNEISEPASDSFISVDGKNFKANSTGFDEVVFFISTNLGEDPKPLVKVASGGEISRIMLALKSILAKTDRLPILIFDEIDTGVSGRIAQKVGQALKDLAKVSQIIAITHLPQIAALADLHFAVEKKKISDRIVSSIFKLEGERQIEEVAKLMSGEIITDASMNSARELMNTKTK